MGVAVAQVEEESATTPEPIHRQWNVTNSAGGGLMGPWLARLAMATALCGGVTHVSGNGSVWWGHPCVYARPQAWRGATLPHAEHDARALI
eukprot:8989258-Alexandrium_andersonii.AAC.1